MTASGGQISKGFVWAVIVQACCEHSGCHDLWTHKPLSGCCTLLAAQSLGSTDLCCFCSIGPQTLSSNRSEKFGEWTALKRKEATSSVALVPSSFLLLLVRHLLLVAMHLFLVASCY